jgi:hypothetical protein
VRWIFRQKYKEIAWIEQKDVDLGLVFQYISSL